MKISWYAEPCTGLWSWKSVSGFQKTQVETQRVLMSINLEMTHLFINKDLGHCDLLVYKQRSRSLTLITVTQSWFVGCRAAGGVWDMVSHWLMSQLVWLAGLNIDWGKSHLLWILGNMQCIVDSLEWWKFHRFPKDTDIHCGIFMTAKISTVFKRILTNCPLVQPHQQAACQYCWTRRLWNSQFVNIKHNSPLGKF